jgi:glycyl-tRNA synthetase beta chain
LSKQDLLLEIGTEEIPAASVVVGSNQLRERAMVLLNRYRLGFEDIVTYGAPRRLALLVRGLDEHQSRMVHEIKGPAKRAAFTEDGTPTKAAEGFAKSQGVSVDSLEVRSIEGGEYVFAVREEEGRATTAILETILPELILSLSFPKAMRWGDGEIRFVRPIRWIVALFGEDIVPFTVGDVASGNASMGHRLLANHPVVIEKPTDYLTDLKVNSVIADQGERAALIREGIERTVQDTGGRAVVHQHTFDEVLELTEYPHAIRASFSQEFAELPREVLVTAMEKHQRYFPIEDASGKLLPNFIVINNGNPEFTDIIRKGHERVIRARLADAKYFFEADSSKPLESSVDRLTGVTFQVRLGTVYQKTQRNVKLAGEIAENLGLSVQEIEHVKRAAYLCKADLMTEMVFEFPELQGVMGRYYALVSGEPDDVAVAIFEHYLPRSAGDILPQTVAGQIVSIADKLDSIAGIIAAGLIPTGSEDPYALRRQSYGIVSIVLEHDLKIPIKAMIELALGLYAEQGVKFDFAATSDLVEDFIRGRLRAYLLAQGLPIDVVEAVSVFSIDDMVDIRTRAEAIAAKLASPEIVDVLAAYTRVKNLAKLELGTNVDENLLQEEAEKKLYESLLGVDSDIEKAGRDYALGIDILARLRGLVDTFFDEVLVMAEDEAIKNNRLRLLNYAKAMFQRVADFSQINPPAV